MDARLGSRTERWCPLPRHRLPGRYRQPVSEAFEIVRAGYDRIGTTYRDLSASNVVRRQWVERLLAELPPRSVVVDLGCGPGEPVTRLLARRHRVLGVDASASQLALARSVAPTALLIQADMTRFAIRPATLDAVGSFYALGHVPSHLHAPLLSSIAGWLRPGGLLLTSAPVSAGDEIDDCWLGVPMYFGGIGEQGMRQAIADAGLRLDDLQVIEEDEGKGHRTRFLWIIARKPTDGPTQANDAKR